VCSAWRRPPGQLTDLLVYHPTQVTQWLYRSVQRPSRPGERAEGGGGGGQGSEERAAGKRPRSPSIERKRSPGRSGRRVAEKEASGRGEERGARVEGHDKSVSTSRCGRPGTNGKTGEGAGSRAENKGGSSANISVQGPDPPALKELHSLVHRMCRAGDGCPSLHARDHRPCSRLHSADIKALEPPPWIRETALTFMRAHPSANRRPGDIARSRCFNAETAWMGGSRTLALRWVGTPKLAETEAPAVPAPHPDAAPSGAPRGAGRKDLLELKRLVERLCLRAAHKCGSKGNSLHKAVHPEDLTRSQASRWVRDELERLVRSHPYRHLKLDAYEKGRCETVERMWRVGLIRQVDTWIEWHDAAASPS
jgi:hypothetical protein